MNPLNGLINYIRSSKAELEKVTWPSRQDTIRYTALVVSVSAILAVFFAALDLGLGKTVDAILSGRNASAQNAPANPASPIPAGGAPDINLTPTDVQAVTPNGNKADVKVETVPTTPSPAPAPNTK